MIIDQIKVGTIKTQKRTRLGSSHFDLMLGHYCISVMQQAAPVGNMKRILDSDAYHCQPCDRDTNCILYMFSYEQLFTRNHKILFPSWKSTCEIMTLILFQIPVNNLTFKIFSSVIEAILNLVQLTTHPHIYTYGFEFPLNESL